MGYSPCRKLGCCQKCRDTRRPKFGKLCSGKAALPPETWETPGIPHGTHWEFHVGYTRNSSWDSRNSTLGYNGNSTWHILGYTGNSTASPGTWDSKPGSQVPSQPKPSQDSINPLWNFPESKLLPLSRISIMEFSSFPNRKIPCFHDQTLHPKFPAPLDPTWNSRTGRC